MRAINDFNFGFDLADRHIEEESYSNFLKLIKDHYGPIDTLSDELESKIEIINCSHNLYCSFCPGSAAV